jgi:regulator of sigma E protease
MGLRNGDKIIAVNGDSIKYFNDIPGKILLGKNILLERDGKKMNINLPENLIEQLVEKKGKRNDLVLPRKPIIIGDFEDTSYAKKAGLKVFDRIVAVDSTTVGFFDEMAPILNAKKGDSVTVSFLRNMQPMQTKALVDANGKLGFYILNDNQFDSIGILKQENKTYGFFEAFPAGVKKAGEKLDFYIQQFKLILNPKTGAYKGLGGFKAMASIFPKNEWNWEVFWNITAFFSIVLAFMNILPIPALDGGHVLFTLIEMVTGRKPSDKFLEYAQIAGMILLFSLLIFANGNDWFGWGRGH